MNSNHITIIWGNDFLFAFVVIQVNINIVNKSKT